MRAFRVEVKNDMQWVSGGRLNEEFFVFAEEIVAAMALALDAVNEMKDQFKKASHPRFETLRITSISEGPAVVSATQSALMGDLFGADRSRSVEQWVASVVEKNKKEANI
jgi:hypothetical protein